MQKSRKVTIDPGHAPGNVNGGRNGYKEYSGMWKLAGLLMIALELRGVQAKFTRTETADPSLTARGRSAAGSDLFISLHSNAANGAARGVEVFYSVDLPGDKALAAKLSREVAAVMGNLDRGAKTRESTNTRGEDYYTVIDAAQDSGVPHVVLIEHGFHDNASDEAILLNPVKLAEMAEAEARVICKYLGVAEAPASPAMPPQDTPAAASKVKFNLFGQKTVEVTGSVINGVSLVAARELLEAMEFVVEWNGEAQAVEVNTRPLVEIEPDELTVLQKIVQAEAGGEDREGKILVANVIFNRLHEKGFPPSIREIVFEPGQFEPTRNGAYERATPSAETVAAVQGALSGLDYSQGALYFRALNGLTPDSWHETALTFLFDHGGHRFYK